MTEPTAFNLTDAVLLDGTVDFYTLIGKTSSADPEEIRQRIQSLYSEATANRDNRNLKKRKEYQTLLELLPPARAALLDAPKRAKYDDFLSKAKAGSSPGDFETFLNDLMGFNEQLEEKTGLLATKEAPKERTERPEPRAQVIKTTDVPASSSRPSTPPRPATTPSRPATPASTPVSGNAYSTSPKKAGGGPGGIIGGVGGFVIGGALGYFAMQHNIVPAILGGIVFAAVGFVALNGKVGGNKISS